MEGQESGKGHLEITLRRSTIGRPQNHKRVAAGLGLKKLNRTVVRQNTPQIRGMVQKIVHLLEVKEID
jgi:large subunit ribosomal protein L30